MTAIPPAAKARLRKALRRTLRDGWERGVFATPERDGERREAVLEGPGTGPVEPAAIDAAIAAAIAWAEAGLVRHTWLVDARTRVTIDARYGAAKLRTLDEEHVTKAMGGKARALRPDTSAPLLRAIGLMNADGTISAKHAKKYKQVNHLVELCRPAWTHAARGHTPGPAGEPAPPLRVLDLGCGSAALTFVLAETLRLADVPARLHGVDVRADVIERAAARAAALGWAHVTFTRSTIATAEDEAHAQLGGPPQLLLALHACNTATDDALAFGLRHAVPAMMVVPCCQHELAQQLAAAAGGTAVAPAACPTPALARHGLLRQDYAALLTDALRVEVLEAAGYAVDVVEFVDDSHTPKNLLLRATRGPRASAPAALPAALAGVRARATALGVDPALLRALGA